jgi:RNA polymerase I-specific transcription initiation factor RRN6
MVLQPCVFQGDTSSATPALGRKYCSRDLRFFNLFIQLSDMSVHEVIVYADSSVSKGNRSGVAVADLSWSTSYRLRKDVRTIGGIKEMDDFLQPEGIETMDEPEFRLVSQQPMSLGSRGLGLAHRVADHRFAYDALIKTETQSTAGNIDIQSLSTQLKQSLDGLDDRHQDLRGTL